MSFDGDILADHLEILGTPLLHLRIRSDRAEGLVLARICDVAPDGASTLISYGILNLKLRDGREQITGVVPGEPMNVSVRLNDTGWRLLPGHRLRLAVSTQMWPMAWPLAQMATLDLDLSSCNLETAVRHVAADTEGDVDLGSPRASDQLRHRMVRPAVGSRQLRNDVETGEAILEVTSDGGEVEFIDTRWTYSSASSQRYRIVEGEPLSAQIEYHAEFGFERDDWSVRTESHLTVMCDESHFFLDGRIAAYEGSVQVRERTWDVSILRMVY